MKQFLQQMSNVYKYSEQSVFTIGARHQSNKITSVSSKFKAEFFMFLSSSPLIEMSANFPEGFLNKLTKQRMMIRWHQLAKWVLS